MIVVIDTSVLIDHLRGAPRAHRALTEVKAKGGTPAASVLTKVEILAGMRSGERPEIRRLIGTLDWHEVDDELAERAGALACQFLRSHPGIDVVDFVVAATAERLGADLLTGNRKRFPMFPNLRDPYAPG